jgi:hypothetical protein
MLGYAGCPNNLDLVPTVNNRLDPEGEVVLHHLGVRELRWRHSSSTATSATPKPPVSLRADALDFSVMPPTTPSALSRKPGQEQAAYRLRCLDGRIDGE